MTVPAADTGRALAWLAGFLLGYAMALDAIRGALREDGGARD